MTLHHRGFPIRKSADRSLFAAPRSLSQLITSFFGSWCQGIHLMLLFAWTFCIGHLTFAVLWIAWVSSYIFRFAIKKLCFFTVSFSSCVFTLVEIVFLPYFVERPIFLNIMSSISVRFYSFTFIRFSMNMVLTDPSIGWWRWWESNPWPPACRAGALPAELHPHGTEWIINN